MSQLVTAASRMRRSNLSAPVSLDGSIFDMLTRSPISVRGTWGIVGADSVQATTRKAVSASQFMSLYPDSAKRFGPPAETRGSDLSLSARTGSVGLYDGALFACSRRSVWRILDAALRPSGLLAV